MRPELIVALDVDTLKRAEDLVRKLSSLVKFFKIGNRLFTSYGPEVVQMVGKRGGKVFLDLKFYDIPNTVQGACYSSTGTGSSVTFSSLYSYVAAKLKRDQEIKNAVQYPVFMITVHATAEIEVLQSAVKGAAERAEELDITRPLIVGVTVLTNEDLGTDTSSVVVERARKAKEAGLDGVVCSVQEALEVRKACGEDFIIVTPGIRPQGAEKNDQKRCATPQEAVKAGANFIVIGRPILEAKDPLSATQAILDSIKPER